MNEPPKSPIKWILLITAVLVCGVAIQNWWRGSGFAGVDQSRSHRLFGWSYRDDRDIDEGPAQRRLRRFDSVTLRGNGTLDIKVGEDPSVRLEGDDDVVRKTKTEVHGDTLVISRKWSWFSHDSNAPLIVHVTMRSLDRLTVHGASNVMIAGVTAGASRITINGTGHVTASGRLNSVSLTINGTGDADLKAMPVDRATIVVNGAGSVSLDVRDSLSATVNGAGDVIYDGDPPHVSSSVHGVGSIRRSGSGESTDI